MRLGSKVFVGIFLLALASCQIKEEVDMIITDAVIYSADSSFNTYEAMVIKGGKVLALGTKVQMEEKYKSDKILSYAGKFIYPGFMDPHSHILSGGKQITEVNLYGSKSWDEVLDRLADFIAKNPESEFVTGGGWDQNIWETKSFPNNTELNIRFPDKKILLSRVDGHAAIVGDNILELTSLKPGQEIEGGEALTEKGKLTGLLIDNAMEYLRDIFPKENRKDAEKYLDLAVNECLKYGLTTVSEAGADWEMASFYDSLARASQMPIRMYLMHFADSTTLSHLMAGDRLGGNRLKAKSFKVLADGALGSRGAFLKKDYADMPGHRGFATVKTEDFRSLIKFAKEINYQVNVHAIGDSANAFVLNEFSKVLPPENDRRWRLEHAQVVDSSDYWLISLLNIIPSIQASHCSSDMGWAGERLGERERFGYAYKALLEEAGIVANGSDYPIEGLNPLISFYSAISRKNWEGQPKEGYFPNQALTRQEALMAMTHWAAFAMEMENEVGSLEPGKYADFVIMDEDLMYMPEADILKAKVREVYLEGEAQLGHQ